jgi:hypothetical protein
VTQQQGRPGVRLVAAAAGSVGSKAIESIVRTSTAADAGFRLERVTLVDQDLLEAGNLVRHEGLPDEVGKRKVDVAGDRIVALAPQTEVVRLHGSVFDPEVGELLDRAVEQAAVVIASFDNPPALFRTGELCARHGKPLLVAEVISGGIGLWLLAANAGPGAPCLVCLARARGEDVRLAEPHAPGARVDYADPVAPVKQARVPADDWTCGVAAALLAGLAVDALRRGGAIADDVARLRLVALRPVRDGPADVATFFQHPLQTTVVDAARAPDCPVCSARPVTDDDHDRNLGFFGPDEEAA